MGLGAALDARSNALALSNAKAVGIGLFLLCIWIAAEAWINVRGARWRSAGGSAVHLRGLGVAPRLAVSGALILLVISRLESQGPAQPQPSVDVPSPTLATPLVPSTLPPIALSASPAPSSGTPSRLSPQAEVFRDYVAPHPSRAAQTISSLRTIADVFNENGFRVRVLTVQDPSGTRHKTADFIKGAMHAAGVRLGMGHVLMGATWDTGLAMHCSSLSEPFGRSISTALAPVIEIPVMVTKRDEEMDIAIIIAGEFLFTREGKAMARP